MPRRNREHDDDPPANGGLPLWLILVLVSSGVCVLVCGGAAALTFTVYKQDVARQQETAERERQRTNQELSHLRKLEAERNRELAEREAKAKDLARHRASQLNYRRDDFRTRVLGLTEGEVQDLLGNALPDAANPPDGADLPQPPRSRLVYQARTYQSDPTELDREAVIVFRDGRAADVLFE